MKLQKEKRKKQHQNIRKKKSKVNRTRGKIKDMQKSDGIKQRIKNCWPDDVTRCFGALIGRN